LQVVNNKAYEVFYHKDNMNNYQGCDENKLNQLCGQGMKVQYNKLNQLCRQGMKVQYNKLNLTVVWAGYEGTVQ